MDDGSYCALTDFLSLFVLSVISPISVISPHLAEGDALGKRQQYVKMSGI